jgi:hypothetical protein
MTEADIDRRLGMLLRQDLPSPDHAFTERVVQAVRVEANLAKARRRAWLRLGADAAAAVALGIAFFFLSQEQAPDPSGIIPLQGPVMAGLVMLGLWGLVSAPTSPAPARTSRAP